MGMPAKEGRTLFRTGNRRDGLADRARCGETRRLPHPIPYIIIGLFFCKMVNSIGKKYHGPFR